MLRRQSLIHQTPCTLQDNTSHNRCIVSGNLSDLQAYRYSLVHLDRSSSGKVAPIALEEGQLPMSRQLESVHTMLSEDASLSSRQYSLLHFLHVRMKSSLQLMHYQRSDFTLAQ